MELLFKNDIVFANYFNKFLCVDSLCISEDSVNQFNNVHRNYFYATLKDHAFSVMKESATVQRIDKTLLSKLFECYAYLKIISDQADNYREIRFNKLLDFYKNSPKEEGISKDVQQQWEEIAADYQFKTYVSVIIPILSSSIIDACRGGQAFIKEMQLKLKAAYPEVNEGKEIH